MMKDIQAFPLHQEHNNEGMTLRDYFAGQALIKMCDHLPLIDAASWSYQYADAMLKERGNNE